MSSIVSASSDTATEREPMPTGPPENFSMIVARRRRSISFEALFVDLEHPERVVGDLAVDPPLPPDLGEIADAAQEPVGDAGRAARALRDLERSLLVDLDVEELRGASDDPDEIFGLVEIEAGDDAEAAPHRRRDHPRARRRADEGEGLDRDRIVPRVRPLVDDELAPELLHRGIEVLLDDVAQAVNLVDEHDVALLDLREDAEKLGRVLEHGTRGRPDRDAELVGDDVGERGLPEAGRPVEEDVIEGLAPLLRGLDEDGEILLHLRLADELAERFRPQPRLGLDLVGRRPSGPL